MGDGRVDARRCSRMRPRRQALRPRSTWHAAAEESGSVISAVLFGALAGTGVLPFSAPQFEETIARGGVGVAPSLKAFATAYAHAASSRSRGRRRREPAATRRHGAAARAGSRDTVAQPAASALDGTTTRRRSALPGRAAAGAPTRSAALEPAVRALLDRIERELPAAARALLARRRAPPDRLPGRRAYAGLYLDRLAARSPRCRAPATTGC